jgi:predicted aconitase
LRPAPHALRSTAIAGNHPGPARQSHGHRDTGQARQPGSRADHDQPISIDRQRWRTHHVDPDFADKANRLATGFENLEASPIFSCTPYVVPEDHWFDQDIVWAKSNAIVYANSVISARTNRHGDFLDVCAAITGRAPLAGFHLPENRTGSLLVRVPPIAEGDGLFYTALGYLVGKRAGDLVPVIDGIRDTPSTEDLKPSARRWRRPDLWACFAWWRDSGKFAHDGPGLIQRRVWFGALGECVESAVTGNAHATTPPGPLAG